MDVLDAAVPILLTDGIPNIQPAIPAASVLPEELPNYIVVLEVTAKDGTLSYYLHIDPRAIAAKRRTLIENGATRLERTEVRIYEPAEEEDGPERFCAVFPRSQMFYFTTRLETARAKLAQLKDPEFDQTTWHQPHARLRVYKRAERVDS
jgi:hypothetical protein